MSICCTYALPPEASDHHNSVAREVHLPFSMSKRRGVLEALQRASLPSPEEHVWVADGEAGGRTAMEDQTCTRGAPGPDICPSSLDASQSPPPKICVFKLILLLCPLLVFPPPLSHSIFATQGQNNLHKQPSCFKVNWMYGPGYFLCFKCICLAYLHLKETRLTPLIY